MGADYFAPTPSSSTFDQLLSFVYVNSAPLLLYSVGATFSKSANPSLVSAVGDPVGQGHSVGNWSHPSDSQLGIPGFLIRLYNAISFIKALHVEMQAKCFCMYTYSRVGLYAQIQEPVNLCYVMDTIVKVWQSNNSILKK